jgi:hypothetical protein
VAIFVSANIAIKIYFANMFLFFSKINLPELFWLQNNGNQLWPFAIFLLWLNRVFV